MKKKVHFFKNDTLSHLKIAYIFTTFGRLVGTVFDSKNFLASNGIGYAFKTSLLSHSFATKQLRVSQVTPIITKQFESENLIQTFQSTSSFWELLAPSKKELFLKCQQAISNPNLELSKLPMAKLCIWFDF